MSRETQFIHKYLERYGEPGESSLQCSERLITKGINADEEEEYKWFHDTISELLPKRKNKKLIKKQVDYLRLYCGPRCN